jgi:phage tail sheath protein FI
MPVQPTYPGVYVEELPSGTRTITGVSTSVTAFVGRTRRGDEARPIRCNGFADFERKCGGLWEESELGYAVQQFFLNGGGEAQIARVATGATAATASIPGSDGGSTFELAAASRGSWGARLRAVVSHGTPGQVDEATAPFAFHLAIEEVDPLAPNPAQAVVTREVFANLSVDPTAPRYAPRVLEAQSQLARVTSASVERPLAQVQAFGPALDGGAGSIADYEAAIARLELADVINLVSIPPPARDADVATAVLDAALAYCEAHRALLLLDPPLAWGNAEAAADLAGGFNAYRSANAAFFYPRIRASDPLQEGRARAFAPGGAVAGVIARTDSERGVWKSPAGNDARLVGALGLERSVTAAEGGVLNPRGVNALRELPLVGSVIWGARTARGADTLASEWKYPSVRRTALYIEQSLERGTRFAVFEPNDEPLWATLRQSITAFMQLLFRQGAFAGTTAREAYLVKCDRETTTQADIDRGVVNVIVGFAPLRPAEFIVLKFQQLAGQ